MKHQAIYNLYPSVKSIKQDGETFIAYDINENEVSIDMNSVNTKASELQSIEDAKPSLETSQASGNQKLLDLGLSQAEATALTGYTPPVAE